MAGPWEKYQTQGAATEDRPPWERYAQPAAQAQPTTFGSQLSRAVEKPEERKFDVGPGVILPSAIAFGRDLVQPIIHPIETAKSLKNIGMGVLEKTGIVAKGEHEKYADAVGQFFKDRYGSWENVKKTLETDPVGAAADVSTILTGGGAAVARAPGVVGKLGQVAGQVGRSVDPIVGAGKVAKGVGHVGAEVLGGLGAHVGGEPLRIAARAGAEGGTPARSFQENLRALVPSEETVQTARQGLTAMVRERGQAYRTEMAKIGLDKTVLDFDKIDDALIKASTVKTYKGQDLSPTTTAIRQQMTEAIQDWRKLDPQEFHTVEGLDALKQKLGDIYEGTKYGTPERVAAREIYNGVRQTIIDQAPQYKKVMEGYEDASKLIKQMEKTLSLNPNASIDTSLRKLQSTLRNNVNTSFGQRKELAQFLVNAGAPNLMERLAGQALQPFLPRGLGKLGMELGALMTGGLQGASLIIGGSPRLLGESAYYLGKGSRYGAPVGRGVFQAGREGRQPSLAPTPNLYQSTD